MSSLQPREITSETVLMAAKSQIIGNNGQILSKNSCTRKVESHISVKEEYGVVLCDWLAAEAGNEMVFGVISWSNAWLIGGRCFRLLETAERRIMPIYLQQTGGSGVRAKV
jgi:hypothetical protein